MRDALPYEMDAIDALINGCTADKFASIGDNTAISRKLSMMIRPTLIPERDDHAFVWGDSIKLKRGYCLGLPVPITTSISFARSTRTRQSLTCMYAPHPT